MKKIPKTVPFFKNSPDNLHCLQACVKSLLYFYFPSNNFTEKEIDEKTMKFEGWSWLPPATLWLHNLGLDVKLYSMFNYKEFGDRGEKYLEEVWSKERFRKEKNNGALENISYIQKSTQEIASAGLWINKNIDIEDLKQELEYKDTLAIGKTIYEWLEGKYVNGTSHYILIIKENSPKKWKVHDPGLPGIKYRRIQQKINNHSMFGDILLVKGIMK